MVLEKFQQSLFYLLIVLLPVQLGRHFWPEFAFVSGVRVDYLSPTLYLTDLLVLGIFGLELFRFQRISGRWLGIFGLVGFLGIINSHYSLSPAVSALKWLKVLEMTFLVYFVANSGIKFRTITTLLLIPLMFESVLAIWQFLKSSSIGGLWFFLGERFFYASTPGIANTMINGQLVLRPYGTFSHPNVLGGFLAVVLPLITFYIPHKSRTFTAIVLSFGFVALFLTMSRIAILVGVIAIVAVLLHKLSSKKIWALGMVGVLAALLIGVQFRVESVEARWELLNVAVGQFLKSPVLGAGAGVAPLFSGARLSNFALFHQPVHNVYVLMLSEVGFLGASLMIFAFGLALKNVLEKKRTGVLIAILSVMALGMFDHYFLTGQQGQILLAVIFGLSFARIEK